MVIKHEHRDGYVPNFASGGTDRIFKSVAGTYDLIADLEAFDDTSVNDPFSGFWAAIKSPPPPSSLATATQAFLLTLYGLTSDQVPGIGAGTPFSALALALNYLISSVFLNISPARSLAQPAAIHWLLMLTMTMKSRPWSPMPDRETITYELSRPMALSMGEAERTPPITLIGSTHLYRLALPCRNLTQPRSPMTSISVGLPFYSLNTITCMKFRMSSVTAPATRWTSPFCRDPFGTI